MVIRDSLAANHYGLMLSQRQVLFFNELKFLGLINVEEDKVSDGYLFLLIDQFWNNNCYCWCLKGLWRLLVKREPDFEGHFLREGGWDHCEGGRMWRLPPVNFIRDWIPSNKVSLLINSKEISFPSWLPLVKAGLLLRILTNKSRGALLSQLHGWNFSFFFSLERLELINELPAELLIFPLDH